MEEEIIKAKLVNSYSGAWKNIYGWNWSTRIFSNFHLAKYESEIQLRYESIVAKGVFDHNIGKIVWKKKITP